MKPKAEKFTFLPFFMFRKEMKSIDYRAFSANMLMILEPEYPDIALKQKEDSYTLYFTQCGKQAINLSGFYNDYLNGKNLRQISKNINTILKKER